MPDLPGRTGVVTKEVVMGALEATRVFVNRDAIVFPFSRGKKYGSPLQLFARRVFHCQPWSIAESLLVAQLSEDSIQQVLGTLRVSEAEVVRSLCGLWDGHQQTLRDIGRRLGISHQRVSQIGDKAVRKLRHYTRTRRLISFNPL